MKCQAAIDMSSMPLRGEADDDRFGKWLMLVVEVASEDE
jgi:hypothetical protein